MWGVERRAVTGRQASVDLPFAPEAAAHGRSFVRHCAAGMDAAVVDDAELLVSEVVSNAVLHGAPAVRLTVLADETSLSVRVADGSSRLPTLRAAAAPDVPYGRGLQIVELLAAAWGVEPGDDDRGKTVWFRLADSSSAAPRRAVVSGRGRDETAWT